MNLHEIVARAQAGRRFEHSALAWARIVRASAGKAHLYEMPSLNHKIACTITAEVYGDEPVPECRTKPRRSPNRFRRIWAENAGMRPWSNYCDECEIIARNSPDPIDFRGYWATIATHAKLAEFYTWAEANTNSAWPA